MNKRSLQIRFLCLLVVVLAACQGDPGGKPPYNGISVLQISTGGTDIGYEIKIPASMDVVQDGMVVQRLTIGIEIRGATSSGFEKKSFSIETRNPDGSDYETSLIDLPKESDWILYAPYTDKSLLNNYLAYDWSRRIGQYAVRTKWVEVEINGQYQGVYLLMERIKRDSNRVNISKLTQDDNASDLVTGGYILKIDKAVGDAPPGSGWPDATYLEAYSFRSDYSTDGSLLDYPPFNGKQGRDTYFIYDYPKAEDITTEQRNYIAGYIRDFETALAEEDFSGTDRLYEDYIDVPSFIDHLILNEMTGNPDAYRLSTFLHKDRHGKLKMGPVWDFNIGFGNDGRSRTDAWIFEYNNYYGGDLWLVPFWWEKLIQDPKFRSAARARWSELRASVFRTDRLMEQIDEQVAFLKAEGAVARNYERWPVIGVPLPFNSFVGQSYDEEVVYLKTWLTNRLIWMDQQILSM